MASGINIYSFSDIQNNYSRYLKTILDTKIHFRILDIWNSHCGYQN